MKHVKVLSTEKPMQADEVAWVRLKDFLPGNALTANQLQWLASQVDETLQK